MGCTCLIKPPRDNENIFVYDKDLYTLGRMQDIRTILGFTANLKKYYVIIAITSIAGALISLVTPIIMKLATDWIVDIASGRTEFDILPLVWLMGGFLSITVVTIIVTDIGGWYGDMLAVKVRQQLSKVYFQHLLKLPQSYYDDEITGKIINRLSRAIANISQFLQFFSNNLLQLLLTITIVIGVLAWYSWPLAVLFVLLIPSNLYLTAKTSVKWQKYESQKNKHFDTASGRFAEVISEMRLVKSFKAEKRELNLFNREIIKMIGLTAKQSRHWHIMNAWRNGVFGVIFALIYSWLFYQTARGNFTIGDMVLLLTLIQQVAFPMRNLSFFVDNYQRAVSNSRDFIDAMNEVPEREDGNSALSVGRGNIEYKEVDFAYQDSQLVLENISFVLPAGKKLALVGESGGGKSTISNLLMRLYEPTSGSIEIDGVDIKDVSRQSLRQHVATVFQDAGLFSGTIRDNITYANPDASDSEIEAALTAANAMSFVEDLPKGVMTEIGERGVKLSGGQKQRIAIARAIIKDAPILILDEATSALDTKSEKEVQQALDRLMKGRTTMIIAHRLSTISNVDIIVTIRGGKIDEIGSPKELARSGGIYQELLSLQLQPADAVRQQLQKYDIAS